MTTPIIADMTFDYGGSRTAVYHTGSTPAAVVTEAIRLLLSTQLGRAACADMARMWDEVLESAPEGAVQLLAAVKAGQS